MKLVPQNEWHIKFWRFYVEKQKFENFDLSGARAGQAGAKGGAPNKIFSTDMKSGPKNECHIKIWRFYV